MGLFVEAVFCLVTRLKEKDGDIQLSSQLLGVCLLFFVRGVLPGGSFMLRQFAVSARRANFELRSFRFLCTALRAIFFSELR